AWLEPTHGEGDKVVGKETTCGASSRPILQWTEANVVRTATHNLDVGRQIGMPNTQLIHHVPTRNQDSSCHLQCALFHAVHYLHCQRIDSTTNQGSRSSLACKAMLE